MLRNIVNAFSAHDAEACISVESLCDSTPGRSNGPDEASGLVRLHSGLAGESIELGVSQSQSVLRSEVARHCGKRLGEVSARLVKEDVVEQNASVCSSASIPGEDYSLG